MFPFADNDATLKSSLYSVPPIPATSVHAFSVPVGRASSASELEFVLVSENVASPLLLVTADREPLTVAFPPADKVTVLPTIAACVV